MTPSTNARPSSGGADREPHATLKKSSCTQTVQPPEAHSHFSARGSGPTEPCAPWSPPQELWTTGEALPQRNTLWMRGLERLREAPKESLQLARTLQRMCPLSIKNYHLEARALIELGRYQECLALLQRPPCVDKDLPSLRITRAIVLEELGRFDEAEVDFRIMYERHSHTQEHTKQNGLAFARFLERRGDTRRQEALVVLTRVRQHLAGAPETACDDLDVELTLSRLLQSMGGKEYLHRALDILLHLRRKKAGNRPDTPCDDKRIEIGLSRVLQDLGGKNVQKAHAICVNLHRQTPGHRESELALAISLTKMATPEHRRDALALLTGMRKRAAGNRVDTACDDRDIELALCRVLQDMGGRHNRQQALAILTRLRQQAAGEVPDTPCNDRTLELALARQWQMEGGYGNQQKALAILTGLRQRAADNRAQAPGYDREVEIALGTLLTQMEGTANVQRALVILTRLRTLSGSKDPQAPCDNQDIEFPLATCLTKLNDWPAFDRWNRERPRFDECHEVEQIQSIRYFQEFLVEDRGHNPRPELLAKALRHAKVAVEKSDGLYSANISQLGHCYRAVACSPYPPQFFGLTDSGEEVGQRARDCFEKARQIDPRRADQGKDQLWRQEERRWLEEVKKKPFDHCQAPCRPLSSYNSTARPSARSADRSPAQGPRLARSSLPEQQTQVQKGFDLLKKTPGYSLQIARQLHKRMPNTVAVYNLETRALTELGRYEESLAVLDRLSADRQELLPCLRVNRGRALQSLGRLHEAEAEFRDLYDNHSRTLKDKKINGLALAVVLQRQGCDRDALAVLQQVRQQLAGAPDTACDYQEVELTLARHFQHMGGEGHLRTALQVLTRLRQKKANNRPDTACDDTKIEISLARLLEDMGGKNVQKAHAIWAGLHEKIAHNREIELGFAICLIKMATPQSKREALERLTCLRRRAAGNRADTACDDKDIELSLGRVLLDIGGLHNRQQAFDIFTRLRQRAAGGRPDTPCADKVIELSLSRCLQMEGSRASVEQSLDILTELRKRGAGNRSATPSHDRDVEISLGQVLIRMEGEINLQQALAILTRLRSLYGLKDPNAPCDNQEIELPLAYCLTQLHDWPAFDHWNRHRPRFDRAHELELLQSIRYFKEFLMEDRRLQPRPDLLQKAFRHAEVAVHSSASPDPSSLSQLGHCYRALAFCSPAVRQQIFGRQASGEQINKHSRDYFDKAALLDPARRRQHKEELWRQWERGWRKQVKEQQPGDPGKEAGCVHDPCHQSTVQQSQQEPSL